MAESSAIAAAREAEPPRLTLPDPDDFILLDVSQADIPPRRSSRHQRVSSDPGVQAVTGSIDAAAGTTTTAAATSTTTKTAQEKKLEKPEYRRHQSRRSGSSPLRYPFHLRTYMPDIEPGDEISTALRNFEKHFLTTETAVGVIQCDERGSNIEEQTWDQEHIIEVTSAIPRKVKPYRFYFINRYLVKDRLQVPPNDAKRLRISPVAFRALLSCYEVPPAFVHDVVHYYQLGGRGTRIHQNGPHEGLTYDLWYMLPTRIQFECAKGGDHARSHSGSNQMNPFHFLHLPDAKLDIRGSQIGLFFQYNVQTKSTTAIVINFQDGRWNKLIEGLQNRVRESLEHNRALNVDGDPFFIHTVYLSSIIRWWNNALRSFNEQLIEYEKNLQAQIDSAGVGGGDINDHTSFNNQINKALHCMSAHLHRFSSEISQLHETTNYIITEHRNFFHFVMPWRSNAQKLKVGDVTIGDDDRVNRGLAQLLTQVKALEMFREELLHKTQNIVGLLFNNISVANERAQVTNGIQMAAILRATQEETKISHRVARASQRLAEEMQKDSISMKTIAIITMLFLPGASFAALLATPFFTESDNPFLKKAGNVWLWVVLTVPTTLMCFGFYFWKRRIDMLAVRELDRDDDIEMRMAARRKPDGMTQ